MVKAFGFLGNPETIKVSPKAYSTLKSRAERATEVERLARQGDKMDERNRLRKEIFAAEELKAVKKRLRDEAKAKFGAKKPISFGKNLQAISKTVRANQFKQPEVRPEQAQQQGRMQNFITTKDEIEVYGDEGLTFFDSKKRRGGPSTGSLFGI